MASSKKPSAAARTIDIFSGKTQVEAEDEAERIKTNADLQEDHTREAVPMEAKLDQWRDKAFEVQEWTSKYFPRDPHGKDREQFRVTRKALQDGTKMLYVERVHAGGDGKSVTGYAATMVHEEDFLEFAKVVVEAARKVKDNK